MHGGTELEEKEKRTRKKMQMENEKEKEKRLGRYLGGAAGWRGLFDSVMIG